MFPNDIKRAPSRDVSLNGFTPRPDIQRPAQPTISQQSRPQPMQPQAPRQIPQQAQQSKPSHEASSPKTGGKIWLKLLIGLLLVIFVGAAAYGGYYYATKIEPNRKNSEQATNSTQQSTTDTGVNQAISLNGGQSAGSAHYVVDAGYPFDLEPKKQFIVSLALPEQLAGVVVTSSESNRGLERYYTDKLNDEIGRWEIGYPKYVSDVNSTISVLAVGSSWLKAAQVGNHAFDNTEDKLESQAQKEAYIAKIKSESETCVKDQAKGFITKDQSFKICFSVIPGSEKYSPVLVLRGYGVKEKQQLLFVGNIRVIDGKKYSDEEGKKFLEDAKNGKLPQATVDEISKIVGALRETTLTVE